MSLPAARVNPVLRRELTERWRGRRAVTTLTAYLVVLALLLYALYSFGTGSLRGQISFGSQLDGATLAPLLGRFLFEWVASLVLGLVLFIGPGYAASSLAGERERRTLPLLQITLLSPLQIALGKLGASVAWMVLLVVAALPLAAATLFLGGVGIGDVLRTLALVVAVALGVAGIALGISALSRRTVTAVVLTYGAVLVLVIGTLIVAAVEFQVRESRGDEGTTLALYANPFYGLADAAGSTRDFGQFGAGLPSVLSFLAQALPEEDQRDEVGFAVVGDGGGGVAIARPALPPGAGPVPLPAPAPGAALVEPPEEPAEQPVWLYVGLLYVLLAALGTATAAARLRLGGSRRGGAG